MKRAWMQTLIILAGLVLWGGRIELLPNESGQGTLLRIQIPWNYGKTEK